MYCPANASYKIIIASDIRTAPIRRPPFAVRTALQTYNFLRNLRKHTGNQHLRKSSKRIRTTNARICSPTLQQLGYGSAAAKWKENLWYLCSVLINVHAASPDPDPNPRGGGQLPNPNE